MPAKDIDPCRLFIGGIDRKRINLEVLKQYFEQYGKVTDTTIARTRPVGFVSFDSASAVNRVLSSCPHVIEGVTLELKEAEFSNQNMQSNAMESPKTDNKLYLGGLCVKTTEQSLAAYFQEFENVISVEIKKNNNGISRGFGFITFDSSSAIRRVLNKSQHKIDGKIIDVQRAIPEKEVIPGRRQSASSSRSRSPMRESSKRFSNDEVDPCKVFLGGLHFKTEEKDLHNYFGRFGDIVDAIVMRHSDTNKSKGFGFVTYSEPYMAEAVLQQKEHTLNDKLIAVRIPKPREGSAPRRGPRQFSPPPPPPPPPPIPPINARAFSPPPQQHIPFPRREEAIVANMDFPKPPSNKTLIIGDVRVESLKSKTHHSFYNSVDFVYLGESKLWTIVDELERRIRNYNYEVIIIFSISFDITYLTFCSQTKVKVLDLEPDFALDTLMGTIKSLKERWSERYPNIKFVWTLPYVPDIPRFNSIKLAKVDCWNNPWSDRNRMSCKMQLFKCYIEGIKTRWDEDSRNTYFIDLNYVMAMGDPSLLAILQNGSFDDSIVCQVEDTLDGLNPSKLFATKFWHQVQKLEEYISNSTLQSEPNNQAVPDFSNNQPWRNNDRMSMEDNSRSRRSGRPSRFDDSRDQSSNKRHRNDSFDRRNKRQSFERKETNFNLGENQGMRFSSNENDKFGRQRSRSPNKGKTLLATPSGSSPYDPFSPSASSRHSRERELSRDSYKRRPSPTLPNRFDTQMQSMNQNFGENIKNAASEAIQSQLASQMQHLLPDVIKGVTEKICAEVMKNMNQRSGW